MSNYVDEQYKKDLLNIIENGEDRETRNGKTRSLFGLQNTYTFGETSELKQQNHYGFVKYQTISQFPILTTKKVNFKSITGELLSFIRGYSDVRDFQKMGTNVWNENCNSEYWKPYKNHEFDLGRIYGVNWRQFRGVDKNGDLVEVDQLANAISMIKNDPMSRKIIVSAWNPAEIETKQLALEPCHTFFQFYVSPSKKRLSLKFYQRSVDIFLGHPFNISSYSLLLCMVAHITGLKPYQMIHTMGDVHLYHDHFLAVLEQINRPSHPLPDLKLITNNWQMKDSWENKQTIFESLEQFEPSNIELVNYVCENTIKAKMNV